MFVDDQVGRHKCYETDRSDDVEGDVDDVDDCVSARLSSGFQKDNENSEVGGGDDPRKREQDVYLKIMKL